MISILIRRVSGFRKCGTGFNLDALAAAFSLHESSNQSTRKSYEVVNKLRGELGFVYSNADTTSS